MNSQLTFKERAKLAKEILSKQSPVSFEEAKQQVAYLSKKAKQVRNTNINQKL